MYTTNFQHYLDEDGNIPTDMPLEARELANFLALLIDDASAGDYDSEPVIRCVVKLQRWISKLLVNGKY